LEGIEEGGKRNTKAPIPSLAIQKPEKRTKQKVLRGTISERKKKP